MKINKIISIVLLLELASSLYKIVPLFLITFSPSQLTIYIIAFSILAILLASAIGIFFNKKWGVVLLWIYILLPFIIKLLIPITAFIADYCLIIINVAAALYLTGLYWWKKRDPVQNTQQKSNL